MEIDQGFQYLYTKIAQGVKLCQLMSKILMFYRKPNYQCIVGRYVNVNIDAIYIRLDGMKYPLVVDI